MKAFDVVVVGAGPAGCATAISCAQRGLRVAVVEQQRFPRFRPGESLHPGIEPLLQQLGVAVRLCTKDTPRFGGHWVQWDGPPRFNSFADDVNRPWSGFHIDRARLDTVLLQQALLLGVQIMQPCRALRPLTDNRQVIGLETEAGPLLAPFVIDASGAANWLSRHHRLMVRRCSPLLVARYGYLKGRLAEVEQAPKLLAEADGWTWVAHVQERIVHWTRLCFIEGKSTPGSVPEMLHGLAQSGPVRGSDVSWRVSTAAAGAGYFMVGDAAGLLDPATSHGVLKALMTGMQAAQVVSECLEQPDVLFSAQAQYSRWAGDWFERDLAQMRHFYGTHPNPPGWLASMGD
ncbi:NAD(P)/FAD-dependent oxidoreductase [Pseudomonas sp. NPDC089569]|uniref:NAD(P)/FAD-dependent oxidoreductase n=1 Tax=Pseudomonas sp. NPDC089569 TaxID=3390722 RepID=UPI003CFFCF55